MTNSEQMLLYRMSVIADSLDKGTCPQSIHGEIASILRANHAALRAADEQKAADDKRIAELEAQLSYSKEQHRLTFVDWHNAEAEADSVRKELAEAKGGRVKTVTLCGSSRFIDIMAVCAWLIEREEKAATMGLHLLPKWYCKVESHLAEHEGVADEMDALHLRKIDLSDEIFVVNCNHYIGESTTREVEYAKSKGIPIRWFTHDPIGELALAALEAAKEKA